MFRKILIQIAVLIRRNNNIELEMPEWRAAEFRKSDCGQLVGFFRTLHFAFIAK